MRRCVQSITSVGDPWFTFSMFLIASKCINHCQMQRKSELQGLRPAKKMAAVQRGAVYSYNARGPQPSPNQRGLRIKGE